MLNAIKTIRAALQLYGAINRHDYDVADSVRAQCGDRLRFHRAAIAVQSTAWIPAPLILARTAREREKTAMGKEKNAPRWTVRNALRLFGERYREAVGIAAQVVTKAGSATHRNRETLRRALRFYGQIWEMQRTPRFAMA